MTTYDCTKDVLQHIERVRFWLGWYIDILKWRAEHHDESKLEEPEKAVYDEFTPKLKELKFGSHEYQEALAGMGEGVKHHYKVNGHHPEHYHTGVNGMTLWDLVEMIADWQAAASVKNEHMDLKYLQQRFNLSDQLADIIRNTMYAADMDDVSCHIPFEFGPLTNFLGPEDQLKVKF